MDALGNKYQMPSFETFCDRLTREQAKIQQADASGSSSQALVAQNSKGKSKEKVKSKKDTPKKETKPLDNPSKGKDSSKIVESTSKTKKKSSETVVFVARMDIPFLGVGSI